MGIIYCLTFPNGKQYIGQTIQKMKTRIQQHRRTNYCTALAYAIKKYNEFQTEVLLEINNDLLDHYEKEFIDVFNTLVPNGYNIRSGGKDGEFTEATREKMKQSHLGKKHPDEVKKKISESNKGKKRSEETRMRQSKYWKEHPMSDEWKAKFSRQGFKHSDETKKKLSDIGKNRIISLETREKRSKTVKKHGAELNLPMYVTKLNPSGYHSSGYIVRHPNYPSKTFRSKDLSDEEKLELALKYYNDINMEKVQRLNGSGPSINDSA